MNSPKVFFIFIMLLCSICTHNAKAQVVEPKSYKLFVNLINAPFDSLFLYNYSVGRNILIPSKKTNEFNWEIIIPDSLVNDRNMVLLASPYENKGNSKQQIRFIADESEKKVVVANIGVDGENNFIYGIYKDTIVFHNESVLSKINNRDTLIAGDLICTDFNLIIKDPNADIAIRSKDPLFSWFMDLNGEEISYDKHLESYIKLSKKFPNSRFLISNLADNLMQYKSKEDARKVYENFSDKVKNTLWAKHIEQFINESKFPNTKLPTIDKNVNEYIIQDSTKYNLVVFTASWCLPCIEEIPILKKIYEDLGENLVITYLSIDDEKGVGSFKKMLKEKNIPWRSLFAYQDINKIKQKYFIEGIPKSILVYPNQDMEVLDVRNDEDLAKLYQSTLEKK